MSGQGAESAGKGRRFAMRGGPLDGEEIADALYVRTGRGRKTTHLSVELGHRIEVRTDDGQRGAYVFVPALSAYVWHGDNA